MSYRSQVCLAVPLQKYVNLLRTLKAQRRLDVIALLRGYSKKYTAFIPHRYTVQASDNTPWVIVHWASAKWDPQYDNAVYFIEKWLYEQTEYQFSRAGEDVDDREDNVKSNCDPLFMTWADSGIDIF